MPHAITLLFDVEDLCWPGSDDIARDLATHLSQKEVQGTFLVVGEKARLLAERGRTDVIAALKEHDLGSHTTTHSIHPTVAEYLADLDWEEGVLRAVDEEGPGLQILESVFDQAPGSWGVPGSSWGPQINRAMQRLNMPTVVYPHTRTQASVDVHWYAGSLVFPEDACVFFDAVLTDDDAFQAALRRMSDFIEERMLHGLRWSGIFICHPTRLRAVEFWDGLNFAAGTNTAPEDYRMPTLLDETAYRTALNNFDYLVDILRENPNLEIQTISELSRSFPPPPPTIYLHQIDEAVTEIVKQPDIQTDFYHFSPAELLDLMARAYTTTEFAPESLRRREVLGPTEEPPQFDLSDEAFFWEHFIAACRTLADHVTRTGHLPAGVYLRGAQWSVGAFYRAAVAAWLPFRSGRIPDYVEWQAGAQFPQIGHEIAVAVQEAYTNWPIHRPDLDPNRLLMHTCFQCWTLRPAYPVRI